MNERCPSCGYVYPVKAEPDIAVEVVAGYSDDEKILAVLASVIDTESDVSNMDDKKGDNDVGPDVLLKCPQCEHFSTNDLEELNRHVVSVHYEVSPDVE